MIDEGQVRHPRRMVGIALVGIALGGGSRLSGESLAASGRLTG